MMYKSEEEFLKAYNPDDYERLSMTTDILILSISDEEHENYRKSSNRKWNSCLYRRKRKLWIYNNSRTSKWN